MEGADFDGAEDGLFVIEAGVISETAAEVACRWSKMKDWQKDGLPTGTPRMRML